MNTQCLRRAAAITLLALAGNTANAQEDHAPKPEKIFNSDRVIAARVEGPWKEIARARINRTWKGVFRYTGANGPQSIPVDISLRGLTRRRVCDFPPLRLDFDKQAAKGTAFRGAGSLKMVTHCFRSERFEQYYLKEYLSYRIYNLVTPLSYRVQGLDLTYIDTSDGGSRTERFAFLIEDPDDVAGRSDLQKLEIAGTRPDRLDPLQTSRFMLFQYLVSNLDWSVLSGPDKNRCCHNSRLIGEGPEAAIIYPIPYDLDASGLVDTHYAAPPANVRVRDVRVRLYRGFCAHNASLPVALDEYRALRTDILALFENEPRLDERGRKNAIRYLEKFYSGLESQRDIERHLIDNCRG